VIREALKSLGLLGLLEVRQGDGTYLRSFESELLPRVIEWGLLLGERRTADLVEARQHLEVSTAQLAAARRDDDDLAALSAALDQMKDAPDTAAFVAADVAFHLAVANAGKNTVLTDVLCNIASLLRVWVTRVIDAAGETSPSYLEHLPVFEAIAASDPVAAAAAMRSHLSSATARLNAALDAEREST
jgi:GntR family transcriptional regulator, transcriptional repressor for pyruvate dehydrogenase complex